MKKILVILSTFFITSSAYAEIGKTIDEFKDSKFYKIIKFKEVERSESIPTNFGDIQVVYFEEPNKRYFAQVEIYAKDKVIYWQRFQHPLDKEISYATLNTYSFMAFLGEATNNGIDDLVGIVNDMMKKITADQMESNRLLAEGKVDNKKTMFPEQERTLGKYILKISRAGKELAISIMDKKIKNLKVK